MAVTRNNANLIDLFGVLLCFRLDRQHRGFDDTSLQASFPSAHSLHGVNKDVASLRFVLVLWEPWASGALGRVFFIGRFRLSDRFPGISELFQSVLCHFRWQG